jgi:hypothetical protein
MSIQITSGNLLMGKSNTTRKIEVYEAIFHQMQAFGMVTHDTDRLRDLIENIFAWSKAHRGEKTQRELDEDVQIEFEKLAKRVNL